MVTSCIGYTWPALIWRVLHTFKLDILPVIFPEVSLGNPDANGFDRELFISERLRPGQIQRVDIGLILLRFCSALLGLPLLWTVYLGGKMLYENDNPPAVLVSVALAGLIPPFFYNGYASE